MDEENKGMYPETKTWNPFVGCKFDCVYCEPSFKRQLKRVGGNIGCEDCSNYRPHCHPTRLSEIPSAEIIFVCGTGDISFCDPDYTRDIIKRIKEHEPRKPKTFYFQSKNPAYFKQFLNEFPENVILLTTLETNRDSGYDLISKAPNPTKRWKDFNSLDYPRKVLTIEPILDFDIESFINIINELSSGSLEYIWIGFDSKNCGLTEPSEQKVQYFINELKDRGINIRGKYLKGVRLE